MADERRPPFADLWSASPPLRRDARRTAAGLPAAAPVSHARPEPPAVSRGRLIAGFAAVVVIGVTATAGLLTSGPVIAGSSALLASSVSAVTTNGAAAASDGTLLAGDGGARSGPRDGGRGGEGRQDGDEFGDGDRQADAGGARSEGAGGTEAPDGSGSTVPDEESRGDQDPAPQEPSTPAPSTPAPAPAPSQPAPQQPAPQPAPEPTPQQPAPQPPAAPQPLRFTGLVEHYTSVLFIRLLSSYTLSLSGEPGATASVSYGSRPAGSVTFDDSGRATLTLGKSLVDLGLTDPIIRAAYSDGTEGAVIEARRDSI